MRRKLLILAGLALGVACLPIVYLLYAAPPLGPQGEVIAQDEDVHTSQIVESGINMLLATHQTVGDGVFRRDAHAKTHGCMSANFKINALDDPYRQGVFAQRDHNFKAWIRFSSGSTSVQSDWRPDVRGMAIKLLGVPGAKLLEGEQDAHTQDFLMIDHPVFFIPNIDEYAQLTRFQGENSQFGYFFQGKNPYGWQWREFRIGVALLTLPLRPLLGTQFHSMTAYKLGTGNLVKYSARPVGCDATRSLPSGWASFHSDGLGRDLAAQLKTAPYCFDFLVQLQVPGKNMPAEDTTIEWSEADSPFVAAARPYIAWQLLPDSLWRFGDNLAFRDQAGLALYPVDGSKLQDSQVVMRVYQPVDHFTRKLEIAEFRLRDWVADRAGD
jgi:hypothetical protein